MAEILFNYNVLWDGSSLVISDDGVSGGNIVSIGSIVFSVSGDYIMFNTKADTSTENYDITLKVTRFFNN